MAGPAVDIAPLCCEPIGGSNGKLEDAGDDAGLKTYDVATNGVSLSVTEQGEGPAVLFSATGFRILPIRGAGR
jgi:hypothetical protein